jgi:2-oxoglutarate ferredoxin oxidoreductase subunit delta
VGLPERKVIIVSKKSVDRAREGTEREPEETWDVKGSGKTFTQILFRDWCKACGICSAFCPRHVIERDDAGKPVFAHPCRCIGCRFCEFHCPDFAITIAEEQPGSGNIHK